MSIDTVRAFVKLGWESGREDSWDLPGEVRWGFGNVSSYSSGFREGRKAQCGQRSFPDGEEQYSPS
jgi:hypothetical protein